MSFGIHHHILKWIQDFLNNTYQIVHYNKCSSTSKDVISGIPQGTVIGPNSFIVAFVNDVPDTVSFTVYMFADEDDLFELRSSSTRGHPYKLFKHFNNNSCFAKSSFF